MTNFEYLRIIDLDAMTIFLANERVFCHCIYEEFCPYDHKKNGVKCVYGKRAWLCQEMEDDESATNE